MAGLGRGRALLQALQQSTMTEPVTPSQGPSPEATPAPSLAPSGASASPSSSTMSGGRGRALLQMIQQQKPGGAAAPPPKAIYSPACDVSPSLPQGPPRGVGRGINILKQLQAAKAAAPAPAQSDVSAVTHQMSQVTVSDSQATTVGKSKYFREVKETAPVVMKGESGRPCDVTANFIYLNFEENNVYEYEVRYEPTQDYKSLRYKLLNEHRDLFKEKTFDGTTLYVPHRLPQDVTELVSTNPFDESKVKVIIMFRRLRKLSEMVHIYNVLFNNIMKDLKLVRFGRQFFNEQAARQFPQHKLEVWPGYVTAVDEYEGGLMLTLDSTHRVLRTQTALSFIREAVQRKGAGWKQAVAEDLIGCSVMTTYNKKLFRVDHIDEQMTPKSTFEKTENGEKIQITYIDYYKKNYGIDIMDWDQPMLISKESKLMPGSEKKTEFMVSLIPELCQLTGLTDKQRNNFTLMKDVATYTRVTPNQRHAAFKQYISNVLNNETAKNRLAGWGLSIADKTIDITARTLDPETICYGNNIKESGDYNAEWSRGATRNPVMMAVDIMRWTVLYTKKDEQCTNEFVDTLMRSSRPMGITVTKPNMVLLPSDRPDAYVTALRQLAGRAPQLVVCVSPTARDDRYSAIKKICCAEHPMPSQVINARTIMDGRKLRSVTQKILLQINCKLGGTLWGVPMPAKHAMIVGIDAYHDASRKSRSVLAFIASYNQSMTQWYSRAVFQERGQEVADSLKSCLVDSLKHYLRVNGRLPEKVIMYRDGVGDGQLKVIQKFEIPQMQICFTTVEAQYKPALTYVVVQKRINTRIFLKAGGGFENPPPGTVVDHGITRRDWYDFLIASQKVNQGTVTPTHYVVVYDDSGMTPDQCQRLTYKLCHLYYNWPGTVRVPAPCQYAHKLAYLVGQSMHQQPSDVMADKLYFL